MTVLDLTKSQGRNDIASVLMQVRCPDDLLELFSVFTLSLHSNPAPVLCSCCERQFTADSKYTVFAICWRRTVCLIISRWINGEFSKERISWIFDQIKIIWQGDTVLHVLCAGNVTELIQHLLEKGVDYTILNKVTDFSDQITFRTSHYHCISCLQSLVGSGCPWFGHWWDYQESITVPSWGKSINFSFTNSIPLVR